MKLTEINNTAVKFVMMSESLIREQDELFIESILDEGLKDVAKKALKVGKDVMSNMAAKGVIMAPKVAKFFNSPYGRIALALAVNAVAIGVAPAAVDDTMMQIGGDGGYDSALDAMQNLVDANDQLPDSLVDNLKGDGDVGNIDLDDGGDIGGNEGNEGDEGNEDAGDAGDADNDDDAKLTPEQSIAKQKQHLSNYLRLSHRLGNNSSAASMDRLNTAIDHIMNAEPENIKSSALESFKFINRSYDLEKFDIADNLSDMLFDVAKLRLSQVKGG